MSYQSQAQLVQDSAFYGRVTSSCVQQAAQFKTDADPANVAVADQCQKGRGDIYQAFTRLAAAGPGIADKVETPDGIDQSLVTDADLLSLTQANWPVVAGLYFNSDGTPI